MFSTLLCYAGKLFSVRGIPYLIILNAVDGSMIDKDGRSTVTDAKGDVAKAISSWKIG